MGDRSRLLPAARPVPEGSRSERMKRKNGKQQNTHHIFRHTQVLSLEFDDFLRLYDPGRLSPLQLRTLFGQVSFELEHATDWGEMATTPEARKFVRDLHAAWPWAAFLLNFDKPLGPSQMIGAVPMLAISLCLVDLHICTWDALGQCAIRVDEGQIRMCRDHAFNVVDQLGRRAEIPAEVLLGRKEAVQKQLQPIL